MGIIILIIIILAIVLGVVLFKTFKNAFKAFSLLFFTLLFIAVILIFFFIQDIQVFKQSFSEEESVYLLDDNGTLIAGFTLQGFNFSTFAPLAFDSLEPLLQEESDRIRVVVKKSALDSTLSSNLTQGYSLASAIASPDYQLRGSAFMVGVAAKIRSDSVFSLAKLVRHGDIAIFPESFVIKVLTFNSNDYKEVLQEQYQTKKESLYDTLGVRTVQKEEVNAS